MTYEEVYNSLKYVRDNPDASFELTQYPIKIVFTSNTFFLCRSDRYKDNVPYDSIFEATDDLVEYYETIG